MTVKLGDSDEIFAREARFGVRRFDAAFAKTAPIAFPAPNFRASRSRAWCWGHAPRPWLCLN